MFLSIEKIYHFIKRFIYYGYHGAKHCEDYDSHGIHALIHAHICRLERFMSNPNNTHTMWTTKQNKGLFRKLKELKELSRRYRDDTYYVGYFTRKVLEKYRDPTKFLSYPNMNRKELRVAFKKDDRIRKAFEDRYFELLQKYAPMFWD